MIDLKKHLFLTGPDRWALSELIRGELGDRLSEAGGYMSLRQRDERGEVSALALLPAAAFGGVEGFEAERYLFLSSPARSDNEVIRQTGTRLLQEALWYPYAVLDSVGGFELVIPQFREALTELLNGDKPLLGVLLSPGEAEAQRRLLRLGSRESLNTQQLHRALRADPDTEILDFGGLGALTSKGKLRRWIGEYLP